jgi:2-polyprenyl-3-methyl-5-hydroxy-6-metoxy-1,4-benzoquinol methylase
MGRKIMQKCPVCESQASREFGTKDGFQLLTCAGCKSLYAVELSSSAREPSSYDEFYSEGNVIIPEFTHQILDGFVETLEPFRQNNRLLDVGCGMGTLLQAAERADWTAEGVEVSRTSVEQVRKAGLKVFHGTLEEAQFPDDYFDVVASIEVIEHVLEPRPLVEEIVRILRPGGLFWGSTPHGRGISARAVGTDWSAVCPPDHLQLFSAHGIKNMFRQAGFSEVRIDTHGVNPFEIIQVWRKRRSGTAGENEAAESAAPEFNVLESSYKLNESFTKSRWRKSLKSVLNKMLSVTRLGDSIKFRAVK